MLQIRRWPQAPARLEVQVYRRGEHSMPYKTSRSVRHMPQALQRTSARRTRYNGSTARQP